MPKHDHTPQNIPQDVIDAIREGKMDKITLKSERSLSAQLQEDSGTHIHIEESAWMRINRQRKEQEFVLRRILDHLDRWYGHHDEGRKENTFTCHWCEFRRDIRKVLDDG